jgi:hypothetical protein
MQKLDFGYFTQSIKWLTNYPLRASMLAQQINSPWLVAQTVSNCLQFSIEDTELREQIASKIIGDPPSIGALEFLLQKRERHVINDCEMFCWQSRIADTGMVLRAYP